MAKPLLDVRGVRKSFGERCVLDGVNLSVDEGDARFLIGPNGAGKSTLLRVITGFMQADAGQVCFDETPLTRLPAYRRHRLGVSQTFQVPQLVGEQTVEDTLLMCMVEELPLWQAMWLTRPSSERLAAVEDTLKKLDVMELAGKPLREIPHGTRKLIEFGAAIIRSPRLLILDEPTAGLDQQETARMAELIASTRGRSALLIVEHDMAFVRAVNAPVGVLSNGRIACEGLLDDGEVQAVLQDIYLKQQPMFAYG